MDDATKKKIIELEKKREQVMMNANFELGRLKGQIDTLKELAGELAEDDAPVIPPPPTDAPQA